MNRLSYRCPPEQRTLPLAKRDFWEVYLGSNCIGSISADGKDVSKDRAHNLRIWKVKLTRGFNNFAFPHVDTVDPDATEPYIITNDDEEIEHNLELISHKMSMDEARRWLVETFSKYSR